MRGILHDPTQLVERDPFGSTAENWSLTDDNYPPSDPTELAVLDRWVSECELEAAARE